MNGKDSGAAGATVNVLVVDDDELVLRAIARMLRLRGYEVRATSDHSEAAKFVGWADVGLFDFDMPERNGAELAKLLAPLPVVLHTGNDRHGTGLPTVAKPSRLEEIEAALLAIVNVPDSQRRG